MEIGSVLIWYLLFFPLFALGFTFVICKKREMRYIFYFIFGTAFGFGVFDAPSVALGYYTYSTDPYLLPVYGVPLTIALAEGFAVAVTIYVYEYLAGLRKKWAHGDSNPRPPAFLV